MRINDVIAAIEFAVGRVGGTFTPHGASTTGEVARVYGIGRRGEESCALDVTCSSHGHVSGHEGKVRLVIDIDVKQCEETE